MGSIVSSCQANTSSENTAGNNAAGNYELPKLPYSFDALAPHIDATTMEIHHGKHHAGYTKKFNAAINETTGSVADNFKDLFANVSNMSAGIRNNGGGYYNHDMFWKIMKPGGSEPSGEILEAINSTFESVDNFKTLFKAAAKGRFGSGWAWLVTNNGKLSIGSTPNQDNPLMDVSEIKGHPVMGIDVWEHAYYLNYQNKRGDYIDAWWNILNWEEIAKRYKEA
ncbi:MAG: superoxide dismutase [Bacteroidia bacterium]|nr:superoxide dismutase [Bacteroidia bacterium]NNC84811.1 superoxide dismutase [Bacteroidia bacterium]NNM16163.1 superoxide dismutase [Bacteroidia bacterium]